MLTDRAGQVSREDGEDTLSLVSYLKFYYRMALNYRVVRSGMNRKKSLMATWRIILKAKIRATQTRLKKKLLCFSKRNGGQLK